MNVQKLPRRRRAGISSLVALVILVLAALGAVTALQIYFGHDHTVLGHAHAVSHWLHTHRFQHVLVLVAGILLVAAGLGLLLAGLLPARHRMLKLVGPDETTVFTMERTGLENDLGAVAERVDGVVTARARFRSQRRMRVEVRTPMRDRSGLRGAVEGAVHDRLAALGPAKSLRVRVRVEQSRT